MKLIFFVALFLTSLTVNDKIRLITYEGQDITTTFGVSNKFIGEYKGRRSGYLMLNEDGSGLYKYDIFGFSPASCKNQPIQIEWGFMVDENNEILKFKREYGFSYPFLLKSIGETSFKGCQDQVLLDFILEYKDGTLGISSSDDWKKQKN